MAFEYLYTCDYSFYLDWGFPTRFTAEGQTVPSDPCGMERALMVMKIQNLTIFQIG